MATTAAPLLAREEHGFWEASLARIEDTALEVGDGHQSRHHRLGQFCSNPKTSAVPSPAPGPGMWAGGPGSWEAGQGRGDAPVCVPCWRGPGVGPKRRATGGGYLRWGAGAGLGQGHRVRGPGLPVSAQQGSATGILLELGLE